MKSQMAYMPLVKLVDINSIIRKKFIVNRTMLVVYLNWDGTDDVQQKKKSRLDVVMKVSVTLYLLAVKHQHYPECTL